MLFAFFCGRIQYKRGVILYLNWLSLAFVLLAEGILAYPAGAVPTIKKLNTSPDTSKTVTKETLTKLSTPRTPSVRALGLSSGTATTAVAPTQKSVSSNDTMRLPGLHGNLIKGLGSKLSSNITPQPGGGGVVTSDLTQRVINLEAEMATKQGILDSGNGINIDGNTISLSDELASLPDKVDDLSQEITDLKQEFDTENYYTASETRDYLDTNYYTKEDIDKVVTQLSNTNIVNEFDPGFLFEP